MVIFQKLKQVSILLLILLLSFSCGKMEAKWGGHFYFDVFDPEGKYLAKVPIRANLSRISEWQRGKLYTVEEDEDGYIYVKRYEVSWNIL